MNMNKSFVICYQNIIEKQHVYDNDKIVLNGLRVKVKGVTVLVGWAKLVGQRRLHSFSCSVTCFVSTVLVIQVALEGAPH